MKTVKTKGLIKSHSIKLYESIKELPISRFHEFQKLMLQDMGVGSDMDSIANHFSTLHHLLINNKSSEALQEAKNLHNNLFMMVQGIGIKSFCFASLIHSIDGELVTDLSSEGAKELVSKIEKTRLSYSDVSEIVENVKKNLSRSFDPTFLINQEIPD